MDPFVGTVEQWMADTNRPKIVSIAATLASNSLLPDRMAATRYEGALP